jgi:DNA-binding transcriptional MerR regulator
MATKPKQPVTEDALKEMALEDIQKYIDERRQTEVEALETQAEQLEEQLEAIQVKITNLTGEEEEPAPPPRREGFDGSPGRKPNARRLNEGVTLADALEKVLRGRKRAVHYRDLTDMIEERKLYKTKSKNLLSTVAVTLKRDDRFKKVEPGYFMLKKAH